MSVHQLSAVCVTRVALLGAATIVSAGALAQGTDCASLKDLTLEDARIDVAEAIVPDPLWPFPPSLISEFLPPDAGVRIEFCRIAGIIEEEIGFEVWLPEDWNGRLEAVGGSAFIGDITYPALLGALEHGSAAAATDHGHRSTDQLETTWAVGRPDRIENYGHRAHHLLARVAKEIVLARYGRAQDFAYFNGWSAGGWQGLTEASLYAEDYDGIIAGAPANNQVRAPLTSLWRDANFPGGQRLTQESAALVAAAAIAQCDPEDGVTDGIISLPESCDFDPGALVCAPGDAAGPCLTQAQADRARLLHGRRSTAGGLDVYPGSAWGTVLQDVSYGGAERALVALMPINYEWSTATFDFDRDIPRIEAELGRTLGRTNPDLREFSAAGGKLLMVQGWTDQIVSPYNTLDYFAAVQAEIGADAAHEFARLYMIPGADHYSEGPGAGVFDMRAVIERWVEHGEAPGRLTGAAMDGDVIIRTRPLCPYPQIALYDGAGDPDVVDSFACAVP